MIEIRIVGIEDLMAFAEIVRGKDVNIHILKDIARELNASSDELLKAEENVDKNDKMEKM